MHLLGLFIRKGGGGKPMSKNYERILHTIHDM